MKIALLCFQIIALAAITRRIPKAVLVSEPEKNFSRMMLSCLLAGGVASGGMPGRQTGPDFTSLEQVQRV